MIEYIEGKLERGESISRDEILRAVAECDTEALYELAHRTTRRFAGDSFDTCSIINIKSGNCSEDCKWCSQSSHNSSNVDIYPLLELEECVSQAQFNSERGVRRFSLVTSGRRPSRGEIAKLCDMVKELRRRTNVIPCVSLGLVDEDDMRLLSEAGVKRYHCNIESSPSFFASLCTTHTVEDKLKVLRMAKQYGIEPCSGGIIGMGESLEDRVDMAILLRDEGILSIPINILNPIKGTRLEAMPVLDSEEYLMTVAVFRILNPRAEIRFSGGRALISDEVQRKALHIGVNAAIMGDMLTTLGTNSMDDLKRFKTAGYCIEAEAIREHIWHPYSAVPNRLPTFWVDSARGVRLKLKDGRELIDGMSSWWAAALGYNNEALNCAAKNQLEKMSHVMFGGIVHDPAIALTDKLLEVLPKGLSRNEAKIFYADSGSVAVEVAMKMALQYWVARGSAKKSTFASIRGGYHGDTFNAMSVCDPVTGMHTIFRGSLPINHFLPRPSSRFGDKCNDLDFNEMEQLFKAKHEEIAAFILEPIVQGAGGMHFYSADYLVKARELCDRYDILLIFDEIATGFGRTGEMFATQYTNIVPDIMTIGKALTGGYMTLGATVVANHIAETISNSDVGCFMHGPTFMANPLACAVATEAVTQYQKMGLKAEIQRIEGTLLKALDELNGYAGVREVRILGAIGVVEMDEVVDMARIQPMFIERGVWIRPFGRLVYMMPPFIISDDDLSKLCSGFTATIKDYLN